MNEKTIAESNNRSFFQRLLLRDSSHRIDSTSGAGFGARRGPAGDELLNEFRAVVERMKESEEELARMRDREVELRKKTDSLVYHNNLCREEIEQLRDRLKSGFEVVKECRESLEEKKSMAGELVALKREQTRLIDENNMLKQMLEARDSRLKNQADIEKERAQAGDDEMAEALIGLEREAMKSAAEKTAAELRAAQLENEVEKYRNLALVADDRIIKLVKKIEAITEENARLSGKGGESSVYEEQIGILKEANDNLLYQLGELCRMEAYNGVADEIA